MSDSVTPVLEEVSADSLIGEIDEVVPATWPTRPERFPDLMRPVEAAQYLRLDELGTHTPISAIRTLNYWRDRGQLKATKFARHVWYLKKELDRFLGVKTEN
jgi:hypothetical protein